MKDLIVVDDFYIDPEKVRAIALSTNFDDVQSLNYPGFQSSLSFSSTSLKASFSKIIGEDLDIDESKVTFGRFRVMTADTSSRLKIHLDGDTDWTGLIYLNLPKQCKGGTAFYRHKKTGFLSLPSNEDARKMGYSSRNELENSIIKPDTFDLSAWTISMFVSMKFNRLILFRGSRLFHSHTCSWGDDAKSGRLTQNFFFNSLTNPSKARHCNLRT